MATCWQRGSHQPHFVHKLHSISPAERFYVYLYVWAVSEISVTTINKGEGKSWKTGEFQMWEMFPRLTKHNPYPPTIPPPSVLKFLSTSEPLALFLVSLLHVSARIAHSWYWLGHWLDDEEIVLFTAEPQNALFFRTTRPALGPTQQPIQWVPAAVCPAVQQPGREPDHSVPCNIE